VTRPRILTVLEHYRPAIKAGGPMASVQDLANQIGGEFAFDILASDRDLGDPVPFAGIEHRSWHAAGNARVRYLAPAERTLNGWRGVLRSERTDALYLNSLFARSSIRILLLRAVGALPPCTVVLAPRGELHPGAFAINRVRKAAWLQVSSALGLFRQVIWQAATPDEEKDIRRLVPRHRARPLVVRVARQVPMALDLEPGATAARHKVPGRARIAFLSRISRKKNLDFALRALAQWASSAAAPPGDPATAHRVEFDIHGPIEDAAYWAECAGIIERLPPAVTVRQLGPASAEDVVGTLSRYHLFLLPTRGESFGRVVVEAMAAGCPLLLSDQTPWTAAVRESAGWAEPLSDPAAFVARIAELVAMDDASFQVVSSRARLLGRVSGAGEGAVEANRRLFREAAGLETGGER
jgi:glycosyltransferase involved in cell wall biosynthesis